MKYFYYINLDERGEFYADVRDENSKTIYELKSDESGVIWSVENGFMNHTRDLDGLTKYLKSIGVLSYFDTIQKGNYV